MKKSELEALARGLVSESRIAMLATYDKDAELGDYPFGSMVRYAISDQGELLLLLSRIAEHSKHLIHNTKVSLLINGVEQAGNEQETERMTLLGQLNRLDSSDYSQQELLDIGLPYFQRYPESEMYFTQLDFDLYQLDLHKARYIRGFARAHWLKDNFMSGEK